MSNDKPEFKPLDAADYMLRLSRFEEKATKNGKGVLISAGFEVVNGDSKGRLVFHNFLVEHTSPKAQEIGNGQLDEYLKAVGAGGLEGINNDRTLLEQWTEIPFVGVLGIEEPREYTAADGTQQTSKARNKIKKFMSR
jgi:Protein of unknown function (DUF669)